MIIDDLKNRARFPILFEMRKRIISFDEIEYKWLVKINLSMIGVINVITLFINKVYEHLDRAYMYHVSMHLIAEDNNKKQFISFIYNSWKAVQFVPYTADYNKFQEVYYERIMEIMYRG